MKTIELLRYWIVACACLWLVSCASPMKTDPVVGQNQKVSVEFTLKLDDGTLVHSNVGKEPIVYQSGKNEGTIPPALEQELMGLKVNDTKQVRLTPEQGFGPVDPRGIQEAKPDQIPPEARKVGGGFVVTDPEGNERLIRVREVRKDKIIVDLNHPLAGQNLNFDVRIVAIEPTTG